VDRNKNDQDAMAADQRERLDAGNREQDPRRGALTDQRDRELTDEERELAKPVAAVPASVNLDEVEPADGFRLPRSQPEAEDARLLADEEARDASRPEVAARLAEEAQGHADKAAGHAQAAKDLANQIGSAYEGPDRPPLGEGWRYRKPEPDVHDPV